MSSIKRSVDQEVIDRQNADANNVSSINTVSAELTNAKLVDGVVVPTSVLSYSFSSQNASVNNQKTIPVALVVGRKYNLNIKSAVALGQTQIKPLLYAGANPTPQTIVDTSANDLSKGYNIPFTATLAHDYLNIQLFGVTATGVNVDVNLTIQAQSDLKTFKSKKGYPFASVTDNAFNASIRALIKDLKLLGPGWNPDDNWCIRIFRKNTASNFLLGFYKSFGNDSIIENATNFSVAIADISPGQTSGLQRIYKVIDANRSIYLELDMAVYQTLNVFQTDLNFTHTGVAKEAYNGVIAPSIVSSAFKTTQPVITLIDDDGSTGFSWLKTLLATYNYPCGIAVVPNWVGTPSYMTLAELKAEASVHEIMCHSQTHAPAVWYPTNWLQDGYNLKAVKAEVEATVEWFLANGFKLPKNFVYPNGGYDGLVNEDYRFLTIKAVQEYYQTGFSTVQGVNNEEIIDSFMIKRVFVNKTRPLSDYQTLIDQCKATSGWLVLSTHSNNASEVDSAYMTSVLNMVQASGIPVKKPSDAWEIKGNIASLGVRDRKNSLYIGAHGALS